MRSGKVPALGDKGNGCETVPPENLSKPFEYLPKTCTYKVGKFGNLGISRDEALKWWPPDPPAPVVEAGAGAISEPEFETKAADVQQEPEEVLVEEASAEVAAAQTEPARKKSDTWGYAADDAPLVDEIIELRTPANVGRTGKPRCWWLLGLKVKWPKVKVRWRARQSGSIDRLKRSCASYAGRVPKPSLRTFPDLGF